MKRKGIIFAILLIAGIFGAQLFGTEFLRTYGFLNEYNLRAFARADLDKLNLFWNILWARGKLFLLLVILASTPARKWLLSGLEGILAFLIGFYGAACVICEGALGIGIFFLSLFPHGLLYGAAFFGFLHIERPVFYSKKKHVLSYILAIAIVLLLLVIGCILETGVGSVLLQRLLANL